MTPLAEIREVVLSVPEVSCEHCVKTMNGAPGALSRVETVAPDIFVEGGSTRCARWC